jgi:hypothetical protein
MVGLGWINGNHTASSLLLQAGSMADENRSLCLQMKVRPLDMFVCCTQDDLLEVYSQGRYSSRSTMSIHNTVEKQHTAPCMYFDSQDYYYYYYYYYYFVEAAREADVYFANELHYKHTHN